MERFATEQKLTLKRHHVSQEELFHQFFVGFQTERPPRCYIFTLNLENHAMKRQTARKSETHQNTNHALSKFNLFLLVVAAQSQLAFEVSPH